MIPRNPEKKESFTMEEPAPRTYTRPAKRGRHAILTPSIKVLIEQKLRLERRKPPEEQAPIRLLAYEIQKELKGSKNRNIPKLSTLEKYISLSRSNPSPLDEPWEIFSLKDYPIPPEALPTILDMWVWMLHNLDIQITIREAQWVARLSGVYEHIPQAMFSYFVNVYATSELIAERDADIQSIGQFIDSVVWSYVTDINNPGLKGFNLTEKINNKPFYYTQRPAPKEFSIVVEAAQSGKEFSSQTLAYRRAPKIREVTSER
jgi:hypothetical protein